MLMFGLKEGLDMYCAYDEEKNIIAFHDKRHVVENYVEKIYNYHKVYLNIVKLRKKNYNAINGLDDLYLVRYGETYVQTGYLVYLQLAGNQVVEDNEYAKDVLFRLLEMDRLNKKDTKTIEKAIEVLDDIIYEDSSYTPSLHDLRNLKTEYDPYIYNTGLYF